MSLSVWVLAILNALAAIPKIADWVNSAVQTAVGWWVSRQTTATLASIADAAAFAARAETDEDRYKAAQMWQDALSRPRVTPS